MDISEKYIKMCEKAQETQKDIISLDQHNYYKYKIIIDKGGNEMYKPIWLPRQDQLQELLGRKFSNWDELRRFVLKTESTYFTIFLSFEQLWLAFVMKEKFNKIWNEENEDWEAVL